MKIQAVFNNKTSSVHFFKNVICSWHQSEGERRSSAVSETWNAFICLLERSVLEKNDSGQRQCFPRNDCNVWRGTDRSRGRTVSSTSEGRFKVVTRVLEPTLRSLWWAKLRMCLLYTRHQHAVKHMGNHSAHLVQSPEGVHWLHVSL